MRSYAARFPIFSPRQLATCWSSQATLLTRVTAWRIFLGNKGWQAARAPLSPIWWSSEYDPCDLNRNAAGGEWKGSERDGGDGGGWSCLDVKSSWGLQRASVGSEDMYISLRPSSSYRSGSLVHHQHPEQRVLGSHQLLVSQSLP